jgi:hypothetical protein
MSGTTPQQRDLAERLIANEGNNSSQADPLAAFQAIEKLRPHLVTLQGNIGFRSLVSRSLAVASEKMRWLRAVHVKSDGSLTGLLELQAQLAPEQFHEGGVALLTEMLELLVSFIGEGLALQLVREVWPNHELAAGRRK